MKNVIAIRSNDFWIKIIEMLQQNWALIENQSDRKVKIFFVNDNSGIFDEMVFDNRAEAETALKRNGFNNYNLDKHYQEFVHPPEPPYGWKDHPNGKIYSSGRYWK